MKTKITLMLVALLGVTSSLSADTPTLEERITAFSEAHAASGLGLTAFFQSDPDHALLAQDIVTALEAQEEVPSRGRVIVNRYAAEAFRDGDAEAAYSLWRLSGNYGNIYFVRYAMTKQEILDHLLGKGPDVFRQVKDHAAPRLNDPSLVDTVGESLIGTGILPGPNERPYRAANDWVQWFDAKVLASEKEEALEMLSAEIKGLLAKPQEDNPAWSARLSSLQGTYAVLSRL